MKNRNAGRRKKKIANVLAVPLLVLLFYAAAKTGAAMGNFFFEMDMGFIEKVDVQDFKTALNLALPLIDRVYNSGKVDASFVGELQGAVKYLFNFDIHNPLTVLNANLPMVCAYYNKSRLPLATGEGRDAIIEKENIAENKKAVGNDGNNGSENNGAGQDSPFVLAEDASSICYEGEMEEKDLTNSDVVSSGKVIIRNETKYKINEAEIKRMLAEPLKINFNRKGPKILIYHTHTTEGYLKNAAELGKKDISGWTQDTRYSVVRIGDELAEILEKKYKIDVIHNGTIHDYPYKSSYANSLKTLDKYLKSYPSIKIFFDIHRDGLGKGQPKLRVIKNVNGKDAAQVMFVVGTNASGLNHTGWMENLKFAVKLQDKLNELCPGLAKPVYVSKNRYNQHVSAGALIIEVGGDGNTVGEALESVKYLSEAISAVIK